MNPTYRTFMRTASSFPTFSKAKKRTVDRGLTLDEARRACSRYNQNDRTPAEVRRGTMMEFEREN